MILNGIKTAINIGINENTLNILNNFSNLNKIIVKEIIFNSIIISLVLIILIFY